MAPILCRLFPSITAIVSKRQINHRIPRIENSSIARKRLSPLPLQRLNQGWSSHSLHPEFFPRREFAAFARRWENTVTIVDLKSGESKWNTDVGLEIGCVGMAGGTVIVVGKDSIVTWNRPGGNRTFNASVNDIVRTTIFDHSSPSRNLGMPHYMSISPDLSRIVVNPRNRPPHTWLPSYPAVRQP